MSRLPLADTVDFLHENSIFKAEKGNPTKEQIAELNSNLDNTIDYSVYGIRGLGELIKRMGDDRDCHMDPNSLCDVGTLVEDLACLIERCLLIKKVT